MSEFSFHSKCISNYIKEMMDYLKQHKGIPQGVQILYQQFVARNVDNAFDKVDPEQLLINALRLYEERFSVQGADHQVSSETGLTRPPEYYRSVFSGFKQRSVIKLDMNERIKIIVRELGNLIDRLKVQKDFLGDIKKCEEIKVEIIKFQAEAKEAAKNIDVKRKELKKILNDINEQYEDLQIFQSMNKDERYLKIYNL
ncbi:uncharacterized protein LOC111623366 [Centruroides sculpturatus]|uniref:uncharacterized protein LOC111623366 n=1 Tax=Centruroides sculpturatus TaxID=218467 RepID=UPI000C6E117A|nr:uncharacterized protein LOC111623366 [Centruroides sculpturatus]